jgi:MFS family permease
MESEVMVQLIAAGDAAEQAVVRKVIRALMPIVCIMYLIAYVDRQNVAYAKLQMVGDLGLSETAYGLGASLFFIGYLVFEVPSNIILRRVGARIWFARIMVSWGLVTLALAWTRNASMFYVLRFMLGVCEAGLFPGILYLLTIWVPFNYRGRLVAVLMIASVIANAIGAPICASLLDLSGFLGLRGWQWMFLVTGGPAILMGIVTLFVLPDGPEEARFLTAREKALLRGTIADENRAMEKRDHANPLRAVLDRRILLQSVGGWGFPFATYGLAYWLPTVVKSFGVSNNVNGLLNVLPWLFAAFMLWWVPRHHERTGEWMLHIAVPVAVGATCLVLSALVPGNTIKFILLCISAGCVFSPQPIIWKFPSSFLQGASVAAGLATVNSIGNLGGFVAQIAVPWMRDHTGSVLAPMFLMGGWLLFSGCVMLLLRGLIIRRPNPMIVPAE